MSPLKFAAALAIAIPAIALAQVGPNPAVNGSLDPSVGPTRDPVTAPDDAPPGDHVSTMSGSTTMPATASDPATPSGDAAAAADDAKRTTAPTSESKHKKPH